MEIESTEVKVLNILLGRGVSWQGEGAPDWPLPKLLSHGIGILEMQAIHRQAIQSCCSTFKPFQNHSLVARIPIPASSPNWPMRKLGGNILSDKIEYAAPFI